MINEKEKSAGSRKSKERNEMNQMFELKIWIDVNKRMMRMWTG
jgi:hypothetical protein